MAKKSAKKQHQNRQNPIMQNFKQPKGSLGGLVGNYMALENQELNEWSVNVLNAQPNESILEVGFGPGHAIRMLTERIPEGYIAGIDYSEIMLKQASKLNQSAIENGRVQLHLATANQLPVFEREFDRIIAVNNMMYWHDPIEALVGLRQALRPNGYIVVVLQRTTGCVENNHDHILEELTWYWNCLWEAGFRDLQMFNAPLIKPNKKRTLAMHLAGLGFGWANVSGIAFVGTNPPFPDAVQ